MDSTQAMQDQRERMQRLDALIGEAEAFPDPAVQAHIREIVGLLLALHGEGLDRMLGHLAGAGAVGESLIAELARDELVSPLLLLHGLHPLDVEDRVQEAIDRVGDSLDAHGGAVELLAIDGPSVRLRLTATGCASTAAAFRSLVEQTVLDAAPEVAAVAFEGVAGPTPPAALVQLGVLERRHATGPVAAGAMT